MWDWIEYFLSDMLGMALERWRRFYACLLSSCAVAGLALWLIPGPRLSGAVSVVAVIVGIAAGFLWERRGNE